MQGGLAAYGFIGNQGAQGLRALEGTKEYESDEPEGYASEER